MSGYRAWVIAALAVSLTAAPAAAKQAVAPEDEIATMVEQIMKDSSLRSVVIQVTRGDEVITKRAFGETLPNVPATTDMRFRNGAVAFAYIATLLMIYVDEGKASLDDPVGKWVPTLPEADQVTLKMLANQTSGYPDFETDPTFQKAFYADPFRAWGYDERVKIAFERPLFFAPGTNWSYSHTNFMILGEILAKIGGKPLDQLLQEKVLGPMGLTQTVADDTGAMPEPVLHAFSSERRGVLGLPADTVFAEETTHWNADWGTPNGASQSTTIDDLTRTAVMVGTGKLLSEPSYHAMTDSNLIGFGQKQDNCVPSCFTQQEAYNYGLGVVRSGDWILQNPLLGGYSATMAYLPEQQISVSVAVTYLPEAFDCQGRYPNSSDTVFRAVAGYLAPEQAPPAAPAFTKATC